MTQPPLPLQEETLPVFPALFCSSTHFSRPNSHWPSPLSLPKSFFPTLTPSSGGSSSQPSSPCALLVSTRVTEGRGKEPVTLEGAVQPTFLSLGPWRPHCFLTSLTSRGLREQEDSEEECRAKGLQGVKSVRELGRVRQALEHWSFEQSQDQRHDSSSSRKDLSTGVRGRLEGVGRTPSVAQLQWGLAGGLGFCSCSAGPWKVPEADFYFPWQVAGGIMWKCKAQL